MTQKREGKRSDIFELLLGLGLTSMETREVFANRTRDVDPLPVYRDRVSGVIYIDDFYVGDGQYEDGSYRKSVEVKAGSGAESYEDQRDTERRLQTVQTLIAGRSLLDFGCGHGSFLKAARGHASLLAGTELQMDCRVQLNEAGIAVEESFEGFGDTSFDVISFFHVLEHLPNPLDVLQTAGRYLSSDGVVIIEVPHARDFLLSDLKCDAFKDFTLWSQHLVLHTQDSLKQMLLAAGFSDIRIEGVQRYPLSNHLKWLAEGKPGGHRSDLSAIESDRLAKAYGASLARIDATDTLMAFARK